jgi:hypothetical protein
MPKEGSRKIKKLIRENSGLEVNLVNSRHVILKVYNVIKN